MPYHPATRKSCTVCEQLESLTPLIDTHKGRATAANQFPVHNWYNFVLGYTPDFPQYILDEVQPTGLVIDPFMGSGTTLVTSKFAGYASAGIDANDFMVDAARTKLDWSLDIDQLKQGRDRIIAAMWAAHDEFLWTDQPSFFSMGTVQSSYLNLITQRSAMLPERYLSDRPLAKLMLIDKIIQGCVEDDYQPFFNLALTAILVPVSNIRYGPGFGVVTPREDAPVLEVYSQKINRMIADLEQVTEVAKNTPAQVLHGDARQLSDYFEPNSANLMITSPPYPGDHEYTKHTRLELVFRGYATDNPSLQTIKRRMLRSATTGIYKEDQTGEVVKSFERIQSVISMIEQRIAEDNATSGFEKLYGRLVGEYFGGMHQTLAECYKVLKPGGQIALLVSDSHAFKMVHIETAALLQDIGLAIGYINPEIRLWQFKSSTAHKLGLRENILILKKPASI